MNTCIQSSLSLLSTELNFFPFFFEACYGSFPNSTYSPRVVRVKRASATTHVAPHIVAKKKVLELFAKEMQDFNRRKEEELRNKELQALKKNLRNELIDQLMEKSLRIMKQAQEYADNFFKDLKDQ